MFDRADCVTLFPGIYDHEGELHVFPTEVCDAMGWPHDEEHFDKASVIVVECIREAFPGIAVTELRAVLDL